ncbi:MAG: alpha/beta hydrolase [Elusimicrobiota bacterium]
MKVILKIVTVIVGIIIVAGVIFYMMSKPMYKPGMVRAEYSFALPVQKALRDNYLRVENDIELYYFSDGEGENIVVIHGGPGYPFDKPYEGLKLLNKNYKFIYYHQRGCGKSTRPFDTFVSKNYYQNLKSLTGKLGLGAQIADIERIRLILRQDRITIIGHSYGAFIASMYAAEFPEKVKSLILISPANVFKMPPDDGGLFDWVGELLPEDMKQDYDSYLKWYFDYKDIFKKSEAELASINSEFIKYYSIAAGKRGMTISKAGTSIKDSGGWMPHAIYLSMGRKYDFRNVLKVINSPVLIIHGDKDLQPVEASKRYTEYFSNSQFHIIKNVGHFSFNEKPDEFASVVSKFLKEVKRIEKDAM